MNWYIASIYSKSMVDIFIPSWLLYCPSEQRTGSTSGDGQYIPTGHARQFVPLREYCPEPHAAGETVPPACMQL